jgi:signal transduction histidine kinase
MKPPRNIRIRFALWTTLLFFAAIALYGSFVFLTMDIFLHSSSRDLLRARADQLVDGLSVESGAVVISERLLDNPKMNSHDDAYTEALIDPMGNILLAEGPYVDSLPRIKSAPTKPYYLLVEPDIDVYTEPVYEKGLLVAIVQVAQSTHGIERMLKELMIVLVASLPFFLLGSAGCGYFLAKRLLHPIDLMTQTARRFSAEELSARINLSQGDDELGRLAETFDEMLSRIEASFKHYRQFTSDASHELRTPVSVIKAIISVTLRKPRNSDEYVRALEDLGAAADRLEILASALLTLSRLDTGSASNFSTVDVSDLLVGTAESLKPLADGKGILLVASIPVGLEVVGDSDNLIHVFINVIGNAIKYTERGSVTVAGGYEGNAVRVVVLDTGIGISENDVPRVFDRFYRAERARSTEGSGLGLSIARAAVERHRGSIRVESELGVGTRIEIILPRK